MLYAFNCVYPLSAILLHGNSRQLPKARILAGFFVSDRYSNERQKTGEAITKNGIIYGIYAPSNLIYRKS